MLLPPVWLLQMRLNQHVVGADLGWLLPSAQLHASAWTVSLTAAALYVV